MGIILAIIVFLITLGTAVLQIMANMMSDAPSQHGISIWPTLIIGGGITSLLLLTHYFPLAW